MANTIQNGRDVPLNVQTGTVPNMAGAMLDWFQPMIFELVTKSVTAFQALEVGEEISFMGVWQPLTGRRLEIKPEGERKWSWYLVHSQICLPLNVDEVIKYRGTQYRIMSQKNYDIYGYYEYELVEDYTGSGPEVSE